MNNRNQKSPELLMCSRFIACSLKHTANEGKINY